MAKYGVLPMNSPVYYPEYNGGIENAHGEIKKWIREHAQEMGSGVPLSILGRTAVVELNHRPRAVLGGKVACDVFFKESTAKSHGKRKRKEVRLWIQNEAAGIMARARESGRAVRAAAAWRRAVRNWLETNEKEATGSDCNIGKYSRD